MVATIKLCLSFPVLIAWFLLVNVWLVSGYSISLVIILVFLIVGTIVTGMLIVHPTEELEIDFEDDETTIGVRKHD